MILRSACVNAVGSRRRSPRNPEQTETGGHKAHSDGSALASRQPRNLTRFLAERAERNELGPVDREQEHIACQQYCYGLHLHYSLAASFTGPGLASIFSLP